MTDLAKIVDLVVAGRTYIPVLQLDADGRQLACAGCPVRAECLEYFLVTVPDVSGVLHYGIAFGGLTPLELHKLVRARRRSGRAPSRTFVLSDAGRRNRTAGQREARACRA